MAKTKTPFLSMGSQGTVGQSLTSQRYRSDTILKEKPWPSYRRTLPQLYQRWLYEDYAYLWTQQTAAVRQDYASAGVRFHLTGFQYWMKYNLKNLPDILGMWHLDEKAGAVAIDSSRYASHGTIIGASPTDLVIDGALHFDGINDVVTLGAPAHLKVVNDFTVEMFARYDLSQGALYNPTGCYHSGTEGYVWQGSGAQTRVHCGNGVGLLNAPFSIDLRDGLKHHLIAVKSSVTGLQLYLDGQPDGSNLAATANIVHHASYGWYIGRGGIPRWMHGDIDHYVIYDRCLDAAEALRHSLRRYP